MTDVPIFSWGLSGRLQKGREVFSPKDREDASGGAPILSFLSLFSLFSHIPCENRPGSKGSGRFFRRAWRGRGFPCQAARRMI
jgi:hypothetical protein